MGILLAIVGVIGVAYVALRIYWNKQDAKPQVLLPEREHDWEKRLAEPEEAAMLRGIQAYRDAGHGLYLMFHDGLLHLYEPSILISMFALGDLFRAADGAATDPIGTVRTLLEQCVAQERPGVLHLKDEWYGPEDTVLDEMDSDQFAELAYQALSASDVEKTSGSGLNEDFGYMYLVTKENPEAPSPEVQAKLAAGQDILYTVGGATNGWYVDLARVTARYRELRATDPAAKPFDRLKAVLTPMCRDQLAGSMWSRVASTEGERWIVIESIGGSKPRKDDDDDDDDHDE